MPFPSLPADWTRRPFGVLLDPGLGRKGRWILLSALVGTVSGLGAIGFDLVFRLAQHLLLHGVGRFEPPGAGMEGGPGHPPEVAWLLPLSLVAGGLVSGALVYGLCPEAEGHGTDAVIRAFHHLRGRIRRRVPVVKALASAITIGSGGSAGREGPIAQIGAGFGSLVADVMRLRNDDRRTLMMAGMAGGIGSIFRAPLGASLFSAEVLYSEPEFEYKVLLPGLISAITGYSIYSSYAGWGYLFDVPPIAFHDPRHLIVYFLLGVVCALVGVIWPAVLRAGRDRVFAPLPVPSWIKPAVGAAGLGLIALVFPEALGMGYGYIQHAIDGRSTIGFLILFAAMKIVATTLTISSGGSGGVFGPSLVIGGAIGAAFGEAAARLAPGLAPEPAACIMVGMCGFFAGVAKVPFASVIMVMEMTGSYGLLVPSLLVAAVTYLFLQPRVSLYESQVPGRVDSPAHLGSFALEVLRRGRIADLWEAPRDGVRPIPPSAPLSAIMDLAVASGQILFPVMDEAGSLLGEVSIEDVRRALIARAPDQVVIAIDLMHPVVGPLRPDDDLEQAARLLADRTTDAVLVVDGPADGRVVGIFSRRDLVIAYARRSGTGASGGSPEQ